MEYNTNPENESNLLLYTNRALWCEVRPNMRKISVEYKRNTNALVLYVYLDTPFTQEELDYDVVGTIIAEMIADFPQVEHFEEEVSVIPFPEKLPDQGLCVFQKYEATDEDHIYRKS